MGFAHVYISETDRYQPEDYGNAAWHAANPEGNYWYVGWEVCQSMGDEAQFLRNEQAVFKDVAAYMKSVGMTPNASTVKLHKEFSSTSCPHRSSDLHGSSVEAVRAYYIEQIKKYMGTTSTTSTTASSSKTVTIAKTATHWSPSSNGKAISNNVKGKSFTVKQERAINYSRSKKEFLLYSGNTAVGWLLEQDAVGFNSTPSNTTGRKVNQGIYTVNELKQVNGIWQVRCNFLVPIEFNWTQNGIACADTVLVDKNGYILKDQTTKNGSFFVFDTNCIKSVGNGDIGSGNYFWSKVTLKNSGAIWLSVKDKNDLINKVSNA